MTENKKYLYLPLEIVIREHDGKATLAHAAANAGWTVLIGPKHALYAVKSQLPEGVFLVKSATPLEAGQIQSLRDAGHGVASHDEEGVVTFKEFLGKNVRYGEHTVRALQHTYFWGGAQQKYFNEAYPESVQKGHVTGSPRLEFWRDYAATVYEAEVAEIKKKYGKYILIPSSFGIANNVMGGDMGVQLTRRHSGKLTKELNDFMIGQGEQNLVAFKEYMDCLPAIAERFPDTNFIIRPHPSESHAVWQEFVSGYKNFHLVYEGSVTPWILAAAAIFHFKSTTSIEAHIMGRSSLTYMPPMPPYLDKFKLELPLAVSRVAKTRVELLDFIADALKDNPEKPPGAIEGLLTEWISVQPGRSSADRMLALLETLKPSPVRGLQAPQEDLKQRMRRKMDSLLLAAADLPLAKTKFSNRFQNRLNSIAYGKRKSSGMDIVHTENIVRVIEGKVNTRPLRVSAFTDSVFVIEQNP